MGPDTSSLTDGGTRNLRLGRSLYCALTAPGIVNVAKCCNWPDVRNFFTKESAFQGDFRYIPLQTGAVRGLKGLNREIPNQLLPDPLVPCLLVENLRFYCGKLPSACGNNVEPVGIFLANDKNHNLCDKLCQKLLIVNRSLLIENLRLKMLTNALIYVKHSFFLLK